MQAMIAYMLRNHPSNSLGYSSPLNQPMFLPSWKDLKHIHLPAWPKSRTTILTSSTVLTLMAARKEEKKARMIGWFKQSQPYLIVPADKRPPTPDPTDLMLSKRGWEKVTEVWCCRLRSEAIDLGVFPESPTEDKVPLPRFGRRVS